MNASGDGEDYQYGENYYYDEQDNKGSKAAPLPPTPGNPLPPIPQQQRTASGYNKYLQTCRYKIRTLQLVQRGENYKLQN